MAAALLHYHVLVMPHDHLPILEVQHGQRRQACGHTGQTWHLVWVVKFQKALEREEENDGLEQICSNRTLGINRSVLQKILYKKSEGVCLGD